MNTLIAIGNILFLLYNCYVYYYANRMSTTCDDMHDKIKFIVREYDKVCVENDRLRAELDNATSVHYRALVYRHKSEADKILKIIEPKKVTVQTKMS